MNFNRKTPVLCSIANQNGLNKHRIENTILVAKQYQEDPDRSLRREKCLCKVCHYQSGRVGGASCTSRPCGLCDTLLYHGNTCIEMLCKPCAKRSGLCCFCGADMELVDRRKRDVTSTAHVFLAVWYVGGTEFKRVFDREDDAEYFANAKMADPVVVSAKVVKELAWKAGGI